ncbi:MAG TPA: arylsulfotransferase family protein [Streptosporangiaceae bacterium]
MTEDLTRRRLFGLAGASAAGAAGLGLSGCAPGAVKQSAALVTTTAATGQGFISRPDLTPPQITLTRHAGATSRYIFLNAPYSGPGKGGSIILDPHGKLIWFGPNTATEHRMDVNVQTYQGKPVLTWFQGILTAEGYGLGTAVIADSSYKVQHVVKAGNGLMADHHEFAITAQGTALITAYRKHAGVDLSTFNGPKSGVIVSGVAQEIDIATGKVLFEWDCYNPAHPSMGIALHESHQILQKGEGTDARPFNYVHINSITEFDSDHLLISCRNTWALYLVDKTTGKIVWRMNGKRSDFHMGPGTAYFWQHHARLHGPGLLSLFDNGANPPKQIEEHNSRGLLLNFDTTAKTVTLHKQYLHPGSPPVLSGAMGSIQTLPSGGVFVGWGTTPRFSEFSASGQLLLDGSIELHAPSYRAFSQNWDGHPTELPAVAARSRTGGGATVYASWNGATNVATWTVFAGKTAGSLAHIGTGNRTGFETAIVVQNAGPYFAVQANDRSGHALSKSAPVRIA